MPQEEEPEDIKLPEAASPIKSGKTTAFVALAKKVAERNKEALLLLAAYDRNREE